jgi:hypothetical protein
MVQAEFGDEYSLTDRCMMEPSTFYHCVYLCNFWRQLREERKTKLTLDAVKSLALFAEVCVLNEEILVPNPLAPQFRYQFNPNNPFNDFNDARTRRDWLEYWLKNNRNWQFVEYRLRLGDYGHTAWFSQYERSYYELEGRREAALAQLPPEAPADERLKYLSTLLAMPDVDIDLLAYVDKVAAAAEETGAILALETEYLGPYLKGIEKVYTSARVSPQHDIVHRYEESQRKRLEELSAKRYRPIYFHAPLFLEAAVQSAMTPEAVLNNIADLHHWSAPKLRELGQYLQTCSQKEGAAADAEIERILSELALGKPVPHPYGGVARVIIHLISISGGVVEALKAALGVSDELSAPNYSRVHGGMRFLNQIHERRGTSKEFYEELQRVFGEVEFSLEELDSYLATPRNTS